MSPTPKIVNFFRNLTKSDNEKLIEALKLYELIIFDLKDIYTLKDKFGVDLESGKPNSTPLFKPYKFDYNDNEVGAIDALYKWWTSPKERAKQQKIKQLDPRVSLQLEEALKRLSKQTDGAKTYVNTIPYIVGVNIRELIEISLTEWTINTDF